MNASGLSFGGERAAPGPAPSGDRGIYRPGLGAPPPAWHSPATDQSTQVDFV